MKKVENFCLLGWVNDIQFDGTGDKLVWVCNNSSISLVTSADPTAVRTLNFNALPLMSIMWKSNECIIGVGFDTCLYSFKVGNEIKMESTFDNESKGKCGKVSAMSHFKSLDTYAISPSAEGPNKNKHNSTIIEIRTYRGNTAKFSTISNEGKMIVWDTKV
ncbi:hypothetical protein A3Q56_02846 [Intoshia linei]|uniref:Actin-related protein 2/3 complex subunit 1A n=1 Tax=Intoshia linei TaxID=1819745 RepID=A0A177B550_9BILA|nr:hypothetical protein A3Q56_02846 [Intoshia linei]